MIERIETDRLVLRRPTPEDARAYIDYYASDWRATHGPVMQADRARRRFGNILEHWKQKGYGRFVAERKDQPGAIGLFGPHWPDTYPEQELTGQLWNGDVLGQGFGMEAMEAVRTHAFGALGWLTAVTYIHPENSRAVRMARKLGARVDPSVNVPAALDGHEAWRHPGPEALQAPEDNAHARRKAAAATRMAPTLRTARFILRPHMIEDFEPYAAFLASDRAAAMHGPHSCATAWQWFTNDIAHWSLFGFGGLIIEARGRPVGQVAITLRPDFPEPELGWFLFDGAEGKGFATSAALALRTFAYEQAGLDTLVSYCDPDNTASIAVAERLGASLDTAAPRPNGSAYLVYRHPAPDSDGNVEAYA